MAIPRRHDAGAIAHLQMNAPYPPERWPATLGAAVKIGKRAFYEQVQMPVDRAYAHTGAVMVENMLHRNTEEGISAFIEKRPAEWRQ